MAEAIGYAVAELLAKRGADQLFQEAVRRVREADGLDDDQVEFLNRALQVVIDFETSYTYNVEHRDSPDVKRFREDVREIGREAAELEVVAEVRAYDRDDSSTVSATATSITALSEECLSRMDALETGQDAEELYNAVTTSRESVPILVIDRDDE